MLTIEEYKQVLSELTAVRYRVDRLNFDIKVHKANLYQKIRRCPQNFGLEKATENSIEAVITLDDKTVELEHELLEARDALNLVYNKYDLVKFEIESKKNEE
ncbi:hypothetical protein FACS18942_05070 [Planctomycetales bacterium]|nr:hypothetical protein FACS18942_05070 [Planctomycetales bacterium]GHT37022.1 hypothetical protein FACS189427_09460 [Planctomycetales bacterium]